jgi:hypothetical protein
MDVIPGEGGGSMPRAADQADEGEFSFDPNLWDEMMKHPGKWVVATETEIVVVGDDAQEVLKIAGAKGIDQPLLFHVPEDPSVSFLL